MACGPSPARYRVQSGQLDELAQCENYIEEDINCDLSIKVTMIPRLSTGGTLFLQSP